MTGCVCVTSLPPLTVVMAESLSLAVPLIDFRSVSWAEEHSLHVMSASSLSELQTHLTQLCVCVFTPPLSGKPLQLLLPANYHPLPPEVPPNFSALTSGSYSSLLGLPPLFANTSVRSLVFYLD